METDEEKKEEPGGGTPSAPGNLNGDSGESGSAGQSVQKSKEGAWISQLPKYMRDSFDPKEIPTQKVLAEKYLELREQVENGDQGAGSHEPRTYTEEEYAEVAKLFTDEQDRKVLKFFKDNHIPPKNIKAFADGLAPTEEDRRVRLEIQRETVQTELRSRWGSQMDANNNYYKRALNTLYSEEERTRIAEKGLNYDADFIDLLSKYGRAMSEGTPANSSYGTGKKDKEKMYRAWGLM